MSPPSPRWRRQWRGSGVEAYPWAFLLMRHEEVGRGELMWWGRRPVSTSPCLGPPQPPRGDPAACVRAISAETGAALGGACDAVTAARATAAEPAPGGLSQP